MAYYQKTPPRGEFVLVIDGAPEKNIKPDLDAALAEVDRLIASGVSRKDAAKQVAEHTGLKKNVLYERSLSE